MSARRRSPLAERASAFERQFLAWLHIRLGVLPKPNPGTTAQWTFEHNNVTVNFAILEERKNGAPPPADEGWLLRVEEQEPYTFIERVEQHFLPGSGVRRRMADGCIRAQYTSSALVQPFIDQSDYT